MQLLNSAGKPTASWAAGQQHRIVVNAYIAGVPMNMWVYANNGVLLAVLRCDTGACLVCSCTCRALGHRASAHAAVPWLRLVSRTRNHADINHLLRL